MDWVGWVGCVGFGAVGRGVTRQMSVSTYELLDASPVLVVRDSQLSLHSYGCKESNCLAALNCG